MRCACASLLRMIEHCEQAKEADIAYWDQMIGLFRTHQDLCTCATGDTEGPPGP